MQDLTQSNTSQDHDGETLEIPVRYFKLHHLVFFAFMMLGAASMYLKAQAALAGWLFTGGIALTGLMGFSRGFWTQKLICNGKNRSLTLIRKGFWLKEKVLLVDRLSFIESRAMRGKVTTFSIHLVDKRSDVTLCTSEPVVSAKSFFDTPKEVEPEILKIVRKRLVQLYEIKDKTPADNPTISER